MKENLEQQIKNTHNDAAQWESKINHLMKENNELKRTLDGAKVSKIHTFCFHFSISFACFDTSKQLHLKCTNILPSGSNRSKETCNFINTE